MRALNEKTTTGPPKNFLTSPTVGFPDLYLGAKPKLNL